MVLTLDLTAGPADRVLFLSGPPPEVGTLLEMRSPTARELVLVECHAGSRSMQVMRGCDGRGVPHEWRAGTRLLAPVEFNRLPGGWWECWPCGVPVTEAGRGRHVEWHETVEGYPRMQPGQSASPGVLPALAIAFRALPRLS